jgi:hypothetical protein
MTIRILVVMLLMMFTSNLKAQLFDEKESFAGVKNVETFFYNGTWDKGFRTLKTMDSLGRVICEKNYRKKDLLKVAYFKYNAQNDRVQEMDVSRINGATRIDTIKTEYMYDDLHEIVYQKTVFNRNLSIEIRLIKAINDTVKHYQYTSYAYHQDIKRTLKHTEDYTVTTNSKHQIILFETKDPVTQEAVVKTSSYDAQGLLQQRKTEWIPPKRIQPLYAGGPGSEEVSYRYVCNSKGRIRITYLVVNHKKYKMARYRYKL